jgi:hypothetical protein
VPDEFSAFRALLERERMRAREAGRRQGNDAGKQYRKSCHFFPGRRAPQLARAARNKSRTGARHLPDSIVVEARRLDTLETCCAAARARVFDLREGRPREQVKVNWKGDETRNEIEFVNRTLDEAYAWLAAANADATRLSEQAFGDMVYACMSGRAL